jgi:sugar phosphate permease
MSTVGKLIKHLNPNSSAIFGGFLCIYWMIYVRDHPSQAKNIRVEEVRHIEESTQRSSKHSKDKIVTPWGTLFGSAVIWAIALSSFSQNFMNVGTVVYLPAYYQTVLGMKLTKVHLNWVPFNLNVFRTGSCPLSPLSSN